MARPLRIEYPGACYHVMNRGNMRATVFRTKAEHELFYRKLAQFTQTYRVSVFCHCCMPNHFHLYLQTAEANLSRFMQGFLTSFTVSLNRRRKTSGHIFQGRFKAHLVQDDAYRLELCRYIHLNPVRIARLRRASVADKRRVLRRYPWSSYRTTIGVERAPHWVDRRALLARFRGSLRDRMKAYRSFVEKGLVQSVANPFENVTEQSILGRDSFVDWVKREFLLARTADSREEPALVHLQRSRSVPDLAAIVARDYTVDAEQLLVRRSRHAEARAVLIYLVSRHCRPTSTLTELAKAFGISVSGLAKARDRIDADSRTNKRLRQRIRRIESKILG